MVRIGISVEGLTEERFVKVVLVPHFSDKEIFVTPIPLNGNISVDRIRRELWAGNVLAEFSNNPEMINNFPETAPSKRLKVQSSYRKTTHGPTIAHHIGLVKLREMCAGFDTWISRMEGLGSAWD